MSEFNSHNNPNAKSFTEIALPLIKLGIAVVYTQQGLRFPRVPDWPTIATTDEAQVRAWGEENPAYNCCCIAKFGGVAMYDIDNLAACLAKGMPPLPETFTTKSPKGFHGYFRHTPETEALGNREVKDENGNLIFELKGNNKACCAPGCSRDDGGEYKLSKDIPLNDGLGPELISWIENNSRGTNRSNSGTKRRFHPEFDEQHLFDYYNWDFADEFEKDGARYFVFSSCPIKGGPHDDQVKSKKTCLILGNTIGFDCKVCGDSYGWKELVKHMEREGIAPYDYMIFADQDDDLVLQDVDDCDEDSADNRTQPKGFDVDTTGYAYDLTDTGNAERLVRRFGQNIKFVRDQDVWRIWDGKRWKTDRRNRVDRMAKIILKELVDHAGAAEGDEQKRRYKWAVMSGGKERRNAMVALAAMEKDIVTVSNDYDKDSWLFNCQNGTIDLKTGDLLPHNRKNLCSRMSRVEFDPAATCPLFDKFLTEVMDGDKTMLNFLPVAVGYSLTGDTTEQAIFFTHGNGANGKSVFNLAVQSIMGDYAKVASFDTFVLKKNDNGPKNDLAALVGARLVQAAESKEGVRLDEVLIKSITGCEEITVRFLHKEFFTYLPQFKIWMSSNNQPPVGGTDYGIWRRLKMIPFEVTIGEERKDKKLPSKLRKEAPGILNWALGGLAEYRTAGLICPEKVDKATAEYKDSQDIVGQFIKARKILRPDLETKGDELYSEFCNWCKVMGEWAMKERRFTAAVLKVAGIGRKQVAGSKWYTGIGRAPFTTGKGAPERAEIDMEMEFEKGNF